MLFAIRRVLILSIGISGFTTRYSTLAESSTAKRRSLPDRGAKLRCRRGRRYRGYSVRNRQWHYLLGVHRNGFGTAAGEVQRYGDFMNGDSTRFGVLTTILVRPIKVPRQDAL